jgi:hypothetical protein
LDILEKYFIHRNIINQIGNFMVYVTKFDGTKQPFDKEKVVRTCLKMHANNQQAIEVANKIERELHDGISTKEILNKIFKYLQKHVPEIKNQTDLRESISMLRSKPDFEVFVSYLLNEYGYKTEINQIIPGEFVEHEIDAVARKNNEVILVEVKHHLQPHTFTGLGVFLETWAKFEDLVNGKKTGKNQIDFNQILIVCNTKISDHADRYADGKGIQYIGWKHPVENSLEQMIEEKKFYPITFLKSLDRDTQAKLGDNGIVLLKQLTEMNPNEISKKIGVKKDKIENLIKKTKELLF